MERNMMHVTASSFWPDDWALAYQFSGADQFVEVGDSGRAASVALGYEVISGSVELVAGIVAQLDHCENAATGDMFPDHLAGRLLRLPRA